MCCWKTTPCLLAFCILGAWRIRPATRRTPCLAAFFIICCRLARPPTRRICSAALPRRAPAWLFIFAPCVCCRRRRGRGGGRRRRACAFAASRAFWSQAVIAEVYTLNALWFFCLLALALRYAQDATAGRGAALAGGVVVGLGVATHWPLLCLAAPGLALLAWNKIKRRPADAAVAALAALATAAALYGWMAARSLANPVYNFYGAMNDLSAFRFYFLREGYAGGDNAVWQDKIAFLNFFAKETLWQFTPPGFALALLGLPALWRASRRNFCALLLAFAGTIWLVFLLDLKPNGLSYAIFSVYPILSYGVVALWLACGLQTVAGAGGGRAALAAAAALAVVVAAAATHWQGNFRRHDSFAQQLAEAKLNSVEQGAIVFISGDFDFPIGYLHFVLGARPDLEIYNSGGLVYGNRLYGPLLPKTAADENGENGNNKTETLRRFISARLRPVYYKGEEREFIGAATNGHDINGFFYVARRDGRGLAQGESRYRYNGAVLQWMQSHLAAPPPPQAWSRYAGRAAAAQVAIDLFNAQESGATLPPAWAKVLAATRARYPQVRIQMDSNLLARGKLGAAAQDEALQFLQTLAPEKLEFADDLQWRDFYLLRARLLEAKRGKDHPQAKADFARAAARAKSAGIDDDA